MHERSGGHLPTNASRLRRESSLMIKYADTIIELGTKGNWSEF